MEHTHIHIYPWAKSKQSNKNKGQDVDPVNKGNKIFYLPVKNKTNLSTNWKTKLEQGAKWGIKQWKQNYNNNEKCDSGKKSKSQKLN